jgi:electron transfer flavoprotein alpha subunit
MSVLVLAEHDLGQLSPATARIVAGAARLGPVDLLVAGHEVNAVAEEAATLAGVMRVLVADQPELAVPASDVLAPHLASLAPRYAHLVAAAAATGRDVIPRLAARLDVMPVTDIVEILSPERFVRPVYAGNALETVLSRQSPNLLTLRASAFAPAARQALAPIEALDVPPVEAAARLIAEHRTEGGHADLSTARIVVAGGVSVGSKEGFALVERLAAALGAAVGATRAAVDAGYAPNDWQIGQTGKIIAPDLYIAIGISGALQHLAGIQGAKTILSINTDPEAPLAKIADLVLVGDLFALVPELIAELERRGLKR